MLSWIGRTETYWKPRYRRRAGYFCCHGPDQLILAPADQVASRRAAARSSSAAAWARSSDPRGGAQVIVATHSPVVAALPGARILSGQWGMREAQWEDTQPRWIEVKVHGTQRTP